MKRCSDDCIPVCDFCSHYNFNADKNGMYTGRGWCRLLHKRKEPESRCKRFRCFNTLSIQDFEKHFRRHFRKKPDCEKRVAEALKKFQKRIKNQKGNKK